MVRVRFAPSPTGYVHIGSLRTALYCYMYAKKHNGSYVLRVEDTDRTRLVEDSLNNLLNEMNWAGIENDEGAYIQDGKILQKGNFGPYIQSERLDIYKKYVDELIDNGHAYYCFCSKERLDNLRNEQGNFGYDGYCRNLDIKDAEQKIKEGLSYVVRMKLPENEDINFYDEVRGDITMNTSDLDDQVILKADGFPTYHLAVVVDDHLMEISHIIRGEEWLSSTPKHILLYRYFGWETPKFSHLPNILGENKKKLSKRNADASVSDYRIKGYLPEALINYLALIGWSTGDDREIMSLEEMCSEFSFERVSKSGGVFDINKLKHINNYYLKNADINRLYSLVKTDLEENKAKAVIELVREKCDTLLDFNKFFDSFLVKDIEIKEEDFDVLVQNNSYEMLNTLKLEFENLNEFNEENIKLAIKKVQKDLGLKPKMVFMPIRIAITASKGGSDLAKTLKILGKEKVLDRLNSTLEAFK